MTTTNYDRLITDYARIRFREDVRDLLDDPLAILVQDDEPEPAQAIQRYRQLAEALGLNFDTMVAEMGSEFERQRLAALT